LSWAASTPWRGKDASPFQQLRLNEAGSRRFEFCGEAFIVTNAPIFGVITNQGGGEHSIRLVGESISDPPPGKAPASAGWNDRMDGGAAVEDIDLHKVRSQHVEWTTRVSETNWFERSGN
jgi:hypothetical protein